MGDIFDQLAAQKTASPAAPAAGDVFDQIHAQRQQPQADTTGEQPASVGGFLQNTLHSAGKFAGDMAGPLLHPMKTLEGVTGLMEGMAEKAGAPPIAGVSHAQNVDALVKMYTDRYGSLDNFRKTLYNDPIGVLADVATLAGGAGVAAKGVEAAADAAKLGGLADAAGTVARGAKTVSEVANPLTLPAKAAGKALAAAGPALNKSALRGGFQVTSDPAKISEAASTMTQNGIRLSDAGAQKISKLLSDLQLQKNGMTSTAASAGVTADRARVMMPLDELRLKYASQVNPQQDLADLDKVAKNFKSNNGPQIPVDRADALKSGTYANNKFGGGTPPPKYAATAEAEKALARGLREELERQLPQIKDLNDQQAKLLNLDGVLQKALNKYQNQGPWGTLKQKVGSSAGSAILTLGAPTAAGLVTHDPMIGGALAVMNAVLSDPLVKSTLAQGVRQAQRLHPEKWGSPLTAMSRVNEYTKALAATEGQQGQK